MFVHILTKNFTTKHHLIISKHYFLPLTFFLIIFYLHVAFYFINFCFLHATPLDRVFKWFTLIEYLTISINSHFELHYYYYYYYYYNYYYYYFIEFISNFIHVINCLYSIHWNSCLILNFKKSNWNSCLNYMIHYINKYIYMYVVQVAIVRLLLINYTSTLTKSIKLINNWYIRFQKIYQQ